jgi:hypothetical protein
MSKVHGHMKVMKCSDSKSLKLSPDKEGQRRRIDNAERKRFAIYCDMTAPGALTLEFFFLSKYAE